MNLFKDITDFPVRELRFVRVWLQHPKDRNRVAPLSNNSEVFMMHKDQVQNFIASQVKLHYSHGRMDLCNSDNFEKLDNLLEIEIAEFDAGTKTFWWCSKNQDNEGARILTNWNFVSVWKHPEYESV